MNFTGSDWCPPCIQLKKDILSTGQFGKYAKEELVLLELDFPRQRSQPEDLKRQNEELAGTFEIEGFPTLILLSPEGRELARHVGYMPGGPERLIQWAEAARK
jgi:protein disulfide-isomerase